MITQLDRIEALLNELVDEMRKQKADRLIERFSNGCLENITSEQYDKLLADRERQVADILSGKIK